MQDRNFLHFTDVGAEVQKSEVKLPLHKVRRRKMAEERLHEAGSVCPHRPCPSSTCCSAAAFQATGAPSKVPARVLCKLSSSELKRCRHTKCVISVIRGSLQSRGQISPTVQIWVNIKVLPEPLSLGLSVL